MLVFFKKLKGFDHAAFWLFIWLFVFDYYFIEGNWEQAILNTSLEVATYIIIAYINLFLLIPFFLKEKKSVRYFAAVTAMLICYVLLLRASGLEKRFYDFEGWRNVYSMGLNVSLFLLISLLYWYFKQWQMEQQWKLIWRNEKLEAELKFLRAQISPHFIFNTLNNIYSLAVQKHDNAAPMVAKLSTLLRYVLYESSDGEISLTKEIDTLRQYIELHLLRKPLSTDVAFVTEGNSACWNITPMLLINFVENAFKHSNIDQDHAAWIKIHTRINDSGRLTFSVENKISTSMSESAAGGIGLQNVHRQLELHYPGKHSLDIKSERGIFAMHLTLELNRE